MFCVRNYCFIADGSSKVPDHKALIIAEIPVNGQLRLPRNLSGKGRKQIKLNDRAKHTYIDFTLIPPITISAAESCLSTTLMSDECWFGGCTLLAATLLDATLTERRVQGDERESSAEGKGCISMSICEPSRHPTLGGHRPSRDSSAIC